MQQRICQDNQLNFRYQPQQRKRLLEIATRRGDPDTSVAVHEEFIEAAEDATRLWLDTIDANIDYWPDDDRYTLSGFKIPPRLAEFARHSRKLLKPTQKLKTTLAELPDFIAADLSISLEVIAQEHAPRFFQAINKANGYEEETRTLPDVEWVVNFLEFLEEAIEFNIEINRDDGGVNSYLMKPLIVQLASNYMEIYQKDDIGLVSDIYFQVLSQIAAFFSQTVSFPLAQNTIKKQIETCGGLVWV